MKTIGDKSKFINTGLEEMDFSDYRCPTCGQEKPVAEKFDLFSRMFFPVSFADTACVCGEMMDRV